MQRVFKLGAMVALLIGGLSVPAQAVPILTTGLTITQGDKLFSNFTCSVIVVGTGVPTSCAGVDVVGSTDQFGNFGLRFQVGAFVNTPGSTVDIIIDYDAQVLAAGFLISDVHLRFNGDVLGTGFANVTETVANLNAPFNVNQLSVQNPPMNLDNVINLTNPTTRVHVTKDILLGVNQPGPGSAAISFVDQFLSQTPEPGSLALLGTAFFGWGVAMRRRFKR